MSSDLNEYKIDDYTQLNIPVDYYGVGTEMITAKPVAALSGVYKLVEDNMGPRIKLSESKRTYPGKKHVYRISDDAGRYLYDLLELEEKSHIGTPLLKLMAKDGERVIERLALTDIRKHCLDCVSRLPPESKLVNVTKPYSLRIGSKLKLLTESLIKEYSSEK